jgi:hypothetical protein
LVALGSILIVWAVASIGCDSNAFVPPQPEELRGAATTITTPIKDPAAAPGGGEIASVRAIEIVLAPRDGDEAEIWKSAARTQAGHEKVKIKPAIADPAQPKSKQIDLVREAMARNPRVLIVEPEEPADSALAAAIEETRAKGIPVVLVGKGLAGDKPASAASADSTRAPLIVVTPRPFAPSARELVAAAVRNATQAGLEPKAGAILVINTKGDQFQTERVDELKKGLQNDGITQVIEIAITGDTPANEKLVKETLKAHPNISLVFSVDYASTVAIRGVLGGKGDSPIVVAGCYTSDSNMQDITNQMTVAAAVDFTPVRLLRKAVTTAALLSQGKVVASPAELSIVVEDRPIHAQAIKAAVANAKNAKETKPSP